MTRDDVFALCPALPTAVEEYPFGDGVAVFKVGGRMFALVLLEGSPASVNLKCDPDVAGPPESVSGGPARVPPEQAPLEHRGA